MALDIFIAFLLQIAFTIGVIFLLGWLIALCNKVFYSNFGRFGNIVCYVTGFIGAPIHELSHALFCLIFFHRIREIKLFQISDDGTMGYVIHSYNRRNMYQRIGNFFIGVAPILVMSGLLFLLAWGLLPEFISDIGAFSRSDTGDAREFFAQIGKVIVSFFSAAVTWQWWVFVLVGLFLALHMTLSGADIRNALGGLLFILVILAIVDVIVGVVSMEALNAMTSAIVFVGSGLLCIMLLALAISVIAMLLSFIARIIRR